MTFERFVELHGNDGYPLWVAAQAASDESSSGDSGDEASQVTASVAAGVTLRLPPRARAPSGAPPDARCASSHHTAAVVARAPLNLQPQAGAHQTPTSRNKRKIRLTSPPRSPCIRSVSAAVCTSGGSQPSHLAEAHDGSRAAAQAPQLWQETVNNATTVSSDSFRLGSSIAERSFSACRSEQKCSIAAAAEAFLLWQEHT